MIRAFAIKLSKAGSTISLWTGRGTITLATNTYGMSKAILRVDLIKATSGLEADSFQFLLNVRDIAIKNFYKSAKGAVEVTLHAIDENKNSVYTFMGIAKNPVSNGRVLRLHAVNKFQDILGRRVPRYWNAQTQGARNDKSFNQASEVATKIRGISWPNQ